MITDAGGPWTSSTWSGWPRSACAGDELVGLRLRAGEHGIAHGRPREPRLAEQRRAPRAGGQLPRVDDLDRRAGRGEQRPRCAARASPAGEKSVATSGRRNGVGAGGAATDEHVARRVAQDRRSRRCRAGTARCRCGRACRRRSARRARSRATCATTSPGGPTRSTSSTLMPRACELLRRARRAASLLRRAPPPRPRRAARASRCRRSSIGASSACAWTRRSFALCSCASAAARSSACSLGTERSTPTTIVVKRHLSQLERRAFRGVVIDAWTLPFHTSRSDPRRRGRPCRAGRRAVRGPRRRSACRS